MQASQGNTNLTRCVVGMRAILASVRLNRLRSKTGGGANQEVGGGQRWEDDQFCKVPALSPGI